MLDKFCIRTNPEMNNVLFLLVLQAVVNCPLVEATFNITSRILCDDKKLAELDVCWSKLPKDHDHRIPSDPRKIESACRTFDAGMNCMKNWTEACLQAEDQEKVKGSIIGAVDTYRDLCYDMKFRETFLQHADCYNRISPHWDTCTKKFTNTLMKINHSSDVLSLCCVRIRYTQCVSKMTKKLCTENASKFIDGLAKSLMESTLKNYHSSRCSNISHRHCGTSEVSSTQLSVNILWVFVMLQFVHGTYSLALPLPYQCN